MRILRHGPFSDRGGVVSGLIRGQERGGGGKRVRVAVVVVVVVVVGV